MAEIRIYLCDDHQIVREGMKRILEAQGDIRVTGQAESDAALMKLLRTELPDVLLLDISLGEANGLEVLARVKQLWPDLRVLMVSMIPESLMGARVAAAGAAGYVSKDSPGTALTDAVRSVHTGRMYFTTETIWQLSHNKKEQHDKPHLALSDRELQVMLLLGAGNGIKEIANSLSLSAKTVSTYKLRIFEKMRFKSTADVVRYMIDAGL